MSFITRQAIRRFSAAATTDHGAGSKTWKILTFVVALPGVAVCMINAYLYEKHHLAHPHQPEFHEYEHLRLRTKRFPWGDGNHSIFHNPILNALPDGYEVKVESHDEEH
ncbi:PREDICTED: cytochrome c oxidase subunit 6A, mitochondrial-like [Priapulus caudatus]|uniref:Cytochrome c oxidase subunit n=1 Tax=Priapulus caudatus TaxID=37621 RepID=A0ABM1EZN2_PRICU|nr:PREDICTED: cytochrome c oxidase subunit 6A, mitochondrial-like [Priapulus caudatus]